MLNNQFIGYKSRSHDSLEKRDQYIAEIIHASSLRVF